MNGGNFANCLREVKGQSGVSWLVKMRNEREAFVFNSRNDKSM